MLAIVAVIALGLFFSFLAYTGSKLDICIWEAKEEEQHERMLKSWREYDRQREADRVILQRYLKDETCSTNPTLPWTD